MIFILSLQKSLDIHVTIDALNDSQEPNTVLMDADYRSHPLSNSDVFNKFDNDVSEESNSDLISNVDDRHHSVSSSRFSMECGKYVIHRVTLNVTWEYYNSALFRGGG